MTKTMGWRLASSAAAEQGDRDYMEDVTSVQFERVSSSKGSTEDASFAVYDGHGGSEASLFAKDHLMEFIKEEEGFYSRDVETVMRAIRSGFLSCHEAMLEKRPEWPYRHNHLSNAGTTVALVIIRGDLMYVAHAGDSAVIMATQKDKKTPLQAMLLTEDHKPESPKEKSRIERNGGRVLKSKSSYRVCWERVNHPGTKFEWTDHMPYLGIARSLGDFWSWNERSKTYLVSPVPDIKVYDLEKTGARYIILVSDGITNTMRAREVVGIVADFDERKTRGEIKGVTAASVLVKKALSLWSDHHKRADNSSAIVVKIEKALIEAKNAKGSFLESWVSTENNRLVRTPVSENRAKKILELRFREVDQQLKAPRKRMIHECNNLLSPEESVDSPPSKKAKTAVNSKPRRSLRLAVKSCDLPLTRSAARKRSSL